MSKFAIVGDSTCDLSKELRDKYDITYVKMHIILRGKEYEANLDWEEFTSKDIYDALRDGEKINTSQVTVDEFKKVFSPYLANGQDVLYISCSSALSKSIDLAELAKKELLEEFPDRKIFLVDSLNACMGQGAQLVKAAELRAEGKSIEEVASWIEQNRLRFNQLCATETLTYLKRAGRVKALSAFFGNIMAIKPIIISDKLGNNLAVEKVKGREASLNRIVEMAKEAIENPQDQTVYITHGDDLATAEKVADKIRKEINPKGVYISVLGPIVGSTTGPGTIAIYVFGKEVTK